jgi:hypothetical protein
MGASDPWVQARNSHDGEAIRKISEALAAVDEEIAQAAWWAHGRAWAQTVVGFHSPSQIHLPEGTEEVPPAFFEGLGRGMGEEWGPKSSIPRPLNLPPQGESALQQGYREGVMRRWLDSSGPSLPDLRIE